MVTWHIHFQLYLCDFCFGGSYTLYNRPNIQFLKYWNIIHTYECFWKRNRVRKKRIRNGTSEDTKYPKFRTKWGMSKWLSDGKDNSINYLLILLITWWNLMTLTFELFFYFSFSCELLVISIISKIILPKKVFQFIFPTEKFSGNQTWHCFLRNPNAKSLKKVVWIPDCFPYTHPYKSFC